MLNAREVLKHPLGGRRIRLMFVLIARLEFVSLGHGYVFFSDVEAVDVWFIY